MPTIYQQSDSITIFVLRRPLRKRQCGRGRRSSVTLGNSLDFVLLLDGEGVGLTDTLGGGDDLISESLSHALVASEARFSGSLAHQVDGLVHSSHWGHVHGLSSDGTAGTDSGGILSGSSLHDGFEEDFQWVLSGEEVDDLQGLSEDPDSLLLFTILSMISYHEHIYESLGDGALNLLETLFLVFSGSVRNVYLSLG